MSVRWDGMATFKASLRRLPEELAHEGGLIVEQHAREAGHAVQSAYPEGPTGNLRRGVRTTITRSRFGASGVVSSRAPHAHIFERGTKARRNKRGANRGSMPAAPESQQMIPVVIRKRRAMVEALKDLVRRAGFEVGD